MKNQVLVLTGPPASGKSLQADKIANAFNPNKVLRLNSYCLDLINDESYFMDEINCIIIDDCKSIKQIEDIHENLLKDFHTLKNTVLTIYTTQNPVVPLVRKNDFIIKECNSSESIDSMIVTARLIQAWNRHLCGDVYPNPTPLEKDRVAIIFNPSKS